MVDKIVGDAVHAIFNAPIDLDDHPTRALDCAMAIREWTERYRSTPEAGALGLERTRIGLETGSAIVGDVGIRTKLDYTAHGDVMNAASRLEAANKELGSSICIGPAAAARIDAAAVRPLGKTSLRGLGDLVPVFEPWPHDMPPSRRERYLEAFRMIDQDRDRAAALFEQLAGEDGGDQVPGAMARRLRRAL
jgi:adenylate cyclase